MGRLLHYITATNHCCPLTIRCLVSLWQQVGESKIAFSRPLLLQAVAADSYVLDAEVLLVDIKSGVPLPFGTLGE